jgi:glucosamine-6-phosphate deaminase
VITLLNTIDGSLVENFFPAAWDLEKWEAAISDNPEDIFDRQPKWHDDFDVRVAEEVSDFDVMFGHELAMEIRRTREEGRELALILPVGPMGMYRWTRYFLSEWEVDCDHVTGFAMDEWSDSEGNTIDPDTPGSFKRALEKAFYEPLEADVDRAIPSDQRFFASKQQIKEYAPRISELKANGAKLDVVYGIGRACHIAFWEPHYGAEFDSDREWQEQTHRIGAELHPMTIEQNAITSFKSRTTKVPAYANTIGPGLFTKADYAIGGADGELGRGMQWQGLSLWVSLRHEKTRHIPSTWMPTLPGVLFFTRELAGPLTAESN